jgi:Protein of unknown function (DUF3592)
MLCGAHNYHSYKPITFYYLLFTMPLEDFHSQPRGRTIFLIALSLVCLAFGVYRLWDIWAFSLTASETEGQIVVRNSASFIIEFNANGQTFQITEDLPSTKGMSGLTRTKLQPGTKVSVLYDPSTPIRARWNNKRNWVFPLALIFVSVLAGLAGLFPNLANSRFRRN